MIFNVAATWKKVLLLLGLATAVFGTLVVGLEVRHENLTSPCDSCSAELAALSLPVLVPVPVLVRVYSHIFSILIFSPISKIPAA
jgi:hypothetical protein